MPIFYRNTICMSCDKNLLLLSLRYKTKFGKCTRTVLRFCQIDNMLSDQIFENKSWTSFAWHCSTWQLFVKSYLAIYMFLTIKSLQRKSIQHIYYNFLFLCQVISYRDLLRVICTDSNQRKGWIDIHVHWDIYETSFLVAEYPYLLDADIQTPPIASFPFCMHQCPLLLTWFNFNLSMDK